MCYLYFFCLHCCLINIHIFDYPDSRLSGLFTEVPTSPDNRGSTVKLKQTGFYIMLFFWRKPRREEDLKHFAQILNQYDSSLVVLFTNFLTMNSVILRLPWQDPPIVKTLIYFDYCSINNEKQLPVPSND